MEEEEEKPTKKRKVGKKQKVKVGEAPVGDVVKGGGSVKIKEYSVMPWRTLPRMSFASLSPAKLGL